MSSEQSSQGKAQDLLTAARRVLDEYPHGPSEAFADALTDLGYAVANVDSNEALKTCPVCDRPCSDGECGEDCEMYSRALKPCPFCGQQPTTRISQYPSQEPKA